MATNSGPRVNAGMLPRYVGQRVVLLGRVAQSGASFVDMTASDGGTVRVTTQLGPSPPNAVLEVSGVVNGDGTIAEESRLQFVDSFNPELYDTALRIAHSPRYAHLFYG